MSSPYPPMASQGQAYGQQQQQQQPYGGQQYAPPPPQQYNGGGQGQAGNYYNQQAPPPSQKPYEMSSQNYAPRPPQQEAPYGNYGSKEKLDDMKPKWNDLWCAVLFIAQFLGFVAISVISLRALGASSSGGSLGQSGGSSITLNASMAYLLAIIAGTGLVLSVIFLFLIRTFTKIVLEITLLLSVVISVAYAAYMWYTKYYSGAIIFTIFAIISIIAYPSMRRRIPFSRELLLFVFQIAKAYPSVYYLAFAGALLQTIYSVYWSFTIVAIYQKFHPDSAGSGTSGGSANNSTVIGLVVFSVFSFYWTSQFIINFFLTIEAGIFGSYYFNGPGAPSVAWGAFKRASTYSFGSIAFGSLIVALLDLLRAGLRVLQSYEQGQGDTIGAAIACCAQCCVGCVAQMVQYFNRYAYIEIALFGKPYIKAAKDTWNLFKDRGIDALVNDCITGNVWTFSSFIVGALCSAFSFIYLKVVQPSFIVGNSNLQAVMIGYAFAIGFFICHTLGYGALQSGVSTIFVGLAEAPDAMQERDPALFASIARTYPKVTTSV